MMHGMSVRRTVHVKKNAAGDGWAVVKGAGRILDLGGTRSRRTYSKVLREARTGQYVDAKNLRRDFDVAVRRVTSKG